MTGNLVVAIIVITGFALTATFALHAGGSGTPGAGEPSRSERSVVSEAQGEGARLSVVGGCESAGGSSSMCECLADRITAAGYDTTGELAALEPQIYAAIQTANPAALPAPIATAYQSCAA
jgi:hypothetical protein